MKKLLLLLLPPILACIVFFVIIAVLSFTDKGKGGLQVTANPKATVLLDGKSLGSTPFCKCDIQNMIPVGSHTIQVIPDDTSEQPFEQQISINKSVITVVDVAFGANNDTSASVISLDPLDNPDQTQLFATSFPDNATILLDKNSSGNTPLLLTSVTESDHDIEFDKDGYKKLLLHISTKKGYKLTAIAFLSVTQNLGDTLTSTSSASPSGTLTPSPTSNTTLQKNGKTTPTITPKATPKPSMVVTVTPSPTVAPTISGPHVTILQTPTGYLNVRKTPSGTVIGQVKPGEVYPYTDTQQGWYLITLSNGTQGWVSGQYVTKSQ